MPQKHSLDAYIEKIDSIASANQALVKVDSLKELLPMLLDIAERTTDAEASSFLRYDPDTGELSFSVVRNEAMRDSAVGALAEQMTLGSGEGIAGRAIAERRSLLVDDVYSTMEFSPRVDSKTGYRTRSILCVPVLHFDVPLGVIQVLNPKHKFSFDELDIKALEIFASLAAVAIVRARHMEEQLKQRELQAQVDMAAKIQRCCWPKLPDLGHGTKLWGRSAPAKEVGGDIYDVIPQQDGSCLLYVADVSGKGLPAGFVMAALWSTIRSEAAKGRPVEELLAAVNAATFTFLTGEYYFATIIMLRYHPDSGEFEVACGGHGLPVLYDGHAFQDLPRLQGLPLGTTEEFVFTSHTGVLPPGGLLLLYSDGVNEAFDAKGEMFGMQRMLDIVVQEGDGWCEALFQALEAWSPEGGQSDDITVLGIGRSGGG